MYFVSVQCEQFFQDPDSCLWKESPQADFSRCLASFTGNNAGEAARGWTGNVWILRKPQENVNTMQLW